MEKETIKTIHIENKFGQSDCECIAKIFCLSVGHSVSFHILPQMSVQ